MPPISLWTSARARAYTAEKWSVPARSRTIKACERSITGQYLSGEKKIPVPQTRRPGNGKTLTVKGAAQNNLKNIDVSIPLGTFTAVTGVSGSGKSSLINEILYKGLAAKLNQAQVPPGQAQGDCGAGGAG